MTLTLLPLNRFLIATYGVAVKHAVFTFNRSRQWRRNLSGNTERNPQKATNRLWKGGTLG